MMDKNGMNHEGTTRKGDEIEGKSREKDPQNSANLKNEGGPGLPKSVKPVNTH